MADTMEGKTDNGSQNEMELNIKKINAKNLGLQNKEDAFSVASSVSLMDKSETEPEQEHPIAPEVSTTGGRVHGERIVANPGKLFLGGLSYNTKESDVVEHFASYGKVIDVVVMKDKSSGKSRGFGFVTFEDANVAAHIVGFPHIVRGRTIDVKRAVPRERSNSRNSGGMGKKQLQTRDVVHKYNANKQSSTESSSDQNPSDLSDSVQHETQTACMESPRQTSAVDQCKVFVGGLPPMARESDLIAYFSKFGKLHSCAVMIDRETHRSRGFGFVTFESIDTLIKVLEQTSHDICGKWVEVKRAESKEFMAIKTNKAQQHNATWYGMAPSMNDAPMYSQQQLVYGYAPPMYGYVHGYSPIYGYSNPPMQYQPPMPPPTYVTEENQPLSEQQVVVDDDISKSTSTQQPMH